MQNWKNGCVFGHIDKFWKEHDRQIKKNACKNAYLGSFFISEKYMIRVLFVSSWTSLIPPLAIRVAPRDSIVKQVNSVGNLILQISRKVQIHNKIKLREVVNFTLTTKVSF